MLVTTWRDGGPAGSARKLSAAIRLALPVLVGGRRTAAGVGAYFDLITDDARLFYGDNFHFGYFRSGSETLAEALDAHTDLVAEMAHLGSRQLVLDAGCGIGGRRRCASPSATAARSPGSTSAENRCAKAGG
jgi:cyclopropane fatty-acyl-phospholipid synthase-like methyltransferase